MHPLGMSEQQKRVTLLSIFVLLQVKTISLYLNPPHCWWSSSDRHYHPITRRCAIKMSLRLLFYGEKVT